MSYIKPHMRADFSEHKLRTVCDTEDVKVFLLYREGTGIMRTQLSFTPEGIHITGDVCLGRDNAGIGTRHFKPLGWFANPTLGASQKYLCEKFLYKQFQLEAAVEDARFNAEHHAENALEDAWDDEERESHSQLAGKWLVLTKQLERCDGDHDAQEAAAQAYYHELSEDSDAFEDFGMDYPRDDAGWLCIIQETFARLYAEQQRQTESEEETHE